MSLWERLPLGKLNMLSNPLKKIEALARTGGLSNFIFFFFDQLGKDLLSAVNSTRISGIIPSSLNSTFITLIPKRDKPQTFADFRPISLCNLLYKLLSKVIATRIKPFLDVGISQEQFGFLKNRQIVEPIGIVQEVLHSIKSKHICAFIIKLDLIKAFDRVNWTFIRLLLIQIGAPLQLVN